MVVFQTEVEVQSISAEQVSDFMHDCSDQEYQHWWPEQAGAAIGLQPRDIARTRLKVAERRQMLQAGAKLSADY